MARPASEHTLFHTWTGIVKPAPNGFHDPRNLSRRPRTLSTERKNRGGRDKPGDDRGERPKFDLTASQNGLIVA